MVKRRSVLGAFGAMLGGSTLLALGSGGNAESDGGSPDPLGESRYADEDIEAEVRTSGYRDMTPQNAENYTGGSQEGEREIETDDGNDGEYRPPGGFDNCENESVPPEEDDPWTPNCDTNPYG